MDKEQLLDLYTRQQRMQGEYPDARREVDGDVIRYVSLTGEDGYVIYSKLNENTADAVIEAQIKYFEGISQDFEWKTFDYDTPPDLVERLKRRGFEIEEPESLLVQEITAHPEVYQGPIPNSVVRITDPEKIDQITAIEAEVWGEDFTELGERLKRDITEHPETISVYISYQEERPVSAAWIYFHEGTVFASLFGGSTLKPFRRQGHYGRMLAVRAQEALSRGFRLLSVDASTMSRPILEKHGFQFLTTTTPCRWTCSRQ